MGNEGDGIDPVGQRADIGAARALGELLGLEGVEKVANEDGNRGPREHPAVNQLRRKSEDKLTECFDEEKLDEIVERQPEEAVDVATNDPSHEQRMIPDEP